MFISNKTLYKGEIISAKYLPIIISLIYISNTLLSYYYVDVCELSMLGGVSVLILARLYWNSYTYKLCEHHRMFLHYIGIHNLLDYIDYYLDGLPISDKGNVLLDIVLFGIFMILYIIFKRKYDFSKKYSSKVS
jgi:hypothetical protein